jgi:hypothetical protein
VKKILEVQNFLATRFVRLVLAGLILICSAAGALVLFCAAWLAIPEKLQSRKMGKNEYKRKKISSFFKVVNILG